MNRIRFVYDRATFERPEARWTIAVLAPLLDAPWVDRIEDAPNAGEGPLVWIGDPSRAPEGAAAVIAVTEWRAWNPASIRLGTFAGLPVPCPDGNCAWPASEREFPDPWLRALTWMLAREEEAADPRRDQWECYSGDYTRLRDLGVLETPLVNLHAAELRRRLDAWCAARGTTLDRVPRWKGGARFAAALTHDVDDVRLYSLAQALRLLRQARAPRDYALRGGLAATLRALQNSGVVDDPYFTFDRWAAVESERGFRSTFYFFAPKPSRRHEYDALYTLNDSVRFDGRRLRVRDLMHELASRGFEIGLHGSYLSHRNGEELAKQKAQLEQGLGAKIDGTRQHFLRFDSTATWHAQAKAGFTHDATLGYNETPGFRAGIAAPFRPWDALGKRAHALTELPTTCMDGALFRTLKLDAASAAAHVRKHLEAVEDGNGLAVLLWHPNAAAETLFPGWWSAYVAALDHLAARGAWAASAGEIATWWSEREKSLRAE